MGIPWTYEPEGFTVNGSSYLPDFYLPSLFGGVYVEIKPKELQGVEKERALAFVKAFEGMLVLICGSPMFGEYSCTSNEPTLEDFVFSDCRKCSGVCYVGIEWTYWGDCTPHTCRDNWNMPLEDGPRIMAAYSLAMSCRFGERSGITRIMAGHPGCTRPNDGPTIAEMMQNAVRATGQK
jgi:hypothetical protein